MTDPFENDESGAPGTGGKDDAEGPSFPTGAEGGSTALAGGAGFLDFDASSLRTSLVIGPSKQISSKIARRDKRTNGVA